uniref:ABC transporter ATP-binding protein n=1 Tax=Panagrellus redivivus TaxID=6233 RepID=A0A7E4VJW8_PANRE
MAPAPEFSSTYTLVPIPGMERVRKNFESIQESQGDISYGLERMEHIPLAVRFGLAERGYSVTRAAPMNHETLRKVYIGDVHGRDTQ